MLQAEFPVRSYERISTSAKHKLPRSFVISLFGPLDLFLIFRPRNLILLSLSKIGIFQVNWLGWGAGVWGGRVTVPCGKVISKNGLTLGMM